ncbi:hypothetical protein PG987_012318, partial [Apiospora arundinis]
VNCRRYECRPGRAQVVAKCPSPTPSFQKSGQPVHGQERNALHAPYSTVTSRAGRRPLSPNYFTPHLPRKQQWNHTSSSAPMEEAPPMEIIDIQPPAEAPAVAPAVASHKVPHLSKEELLGFVDYYDDISVEERLEFLKDPYMRKYAPPEDTSLNISDRPYELLAPTPEEVERGSQDDMETVAKLRAAVYSRLLRPHNVDLEPWGYDVEAEAALHLWREMEHDVGVKGNEVTFNILFDVASKAGKFALAEMIYQEMNTRGFQFNRFHHVSLIHFFGLKMDGGGVRAAYRQMVNASEIIDSTVLNCVMAGLLRCGEEDSALQLYNKMKATDRRSKIIPERNYTLQKKMTKVFLMFARVGRKHPELQRGFQSTSLTTPDLYTYRILVNHFGVKLGDMSKVAQFLDEMKFFRVPLHGSVFLALFKGFNRYGNTEGSDWSTQRLESVWHAFLDAHDDGADGLYISTWMAMWILRSFAECTEVPGSRPGRIRGAQLPMGAGSAESKFYQKRLVFIYRAQFDGPQDDDIINNGIGFWAPGAAWAWAHIDGGESVHYI